MKTLEWIGGYLLIGSLFIGFTYTEKDTEKPHFLFNVLLTLMFWPLLVGIMLGKSLRSAL